MSEPCKSCDGLGELEDDAWRRAPCPRCKGEGVDPGTPCYSGRRPVPAKAVEPQDYADLKGKAMAIEHERDVLSELASDSGAECLRLRKQLDASLGALQALADRVGVLAAHGRPPALNELELVKAVEAIANARGE